MAAPIGNNFWELCSKHGRDKLFESPELLWEAACEYFKWCVDNPLMKVDFVVVREKDASTGNTTSAAKSINIPKMRPFTLQGLCIYLGCSSSYFRVFKSQERINKEAFVTVIEKIEEIIFNQQFSGAAAGFLKENIISRSLGLKDNFNTEMSGKDGKPLNEPIDYSKLSVETLRAINSAAKPKEGEAGVGE